MALGKYSPTVVKSYQIDQDWFRNYSAENNEEFDPEGYDSYGYNENGFDRAGVHENDYMFNEKLYEENDSAWRNLPVIGSPEYLEKTINELDVNIVFNKAIYSEKFRNLTIEQKRKFVDFFETL